MCLKSNERPMMDYLNKTMRHFKGDLYLLIDISENSETGEGDAVYRALYGDCKLYTRPYTMFCEEVPIEQENPTGQKYRFEHYIVPSVKK